MGPSIAEPSCSCASAWSSAGRNIGRGRPLMLEAAAVAAAYWRVAFGLLSCALVAPARPVLAALPEEASSELAAVGTDDLAAGEEPPLQAATAS